jgi:hypothetical protein
VQENQIAMLTESVHQLSQQDAVLQQHQLQRPATNPAGQPFISPLRTIDSQHQALPAPFPMHMTQTTTNPQSEIARCMLASQFMGMMSVFFFLTITL